MLAGCGSRPCHQSLVVEAIFSWLTVATFSYSPLLIAPSASGHSAADQPPTTPHQAVCQATEPVQSLNDDTEHTDFGAN